jgi:hypothetical protein
MVAVIGGMLLTNTELIDTYGEGIGTIGTAFLILGIFTVLTAMCGMCGVKSFNKKYLAGYCVILAIILGVEIGMASYAIQNARAETVYNLCVQKNTTMMPIDPATGEAVDCTSFQSNDLRLGSYLLWQTLWNDAQLYSDDPVTYKQKKTQYVFLQHLQESGRCCGFGKPIEFDDVSVCKPSNKKWDVGGNSISYQNCYGYDDASFENLAEGAEPVYKGTVPHLKGLYCQYKPKPSSTFGTRDCMSTSVLTSDRKQMQYDFPMGDCVSRCHAYGCAEAIYSYVEARLATLGLIVLVVVLVNAIALVIAVCILCAHHSGLSDDDPHTRGIQNSGNVSKRGGKDTEMV